MSSSKKQVNHYQILGVERDATPQQIKEAYRRLAKQLHPDKNGGPEAKEQFQLVNEANAILSDPSKRRQYDASLDAGVEYHESDDMMDPGVGGGIPLDDLLRGLFTNLGSMPNNFDKGMPGNFHDFGTMPGGSTPKNFFRAQGQHSHRRHSHHAPEPKTLTVMFTLEELFKKEQKKVTFSRKVPCDFCHGLGAASADILTCPSCKGQGQKLYIRRQGFGFVQQSMSKCEECNGRGNRIIKPCSACHGQQYIEQSASIIIIMDGSAEDGTSKVFPDMGDQSKDGLFGDLIVTLKQTVHPVFTRSTSNPQDLKTTIKITLSEALTGYTIDLKKLDGSKINERITSVIKPGEVRSIRGAGLPVGNKFGDLHIEFEVVFPDQVHQSRYPYIQDLLKDPQIALATEYPLAEGNTNQEGGQMNRKPTLFNYAINILKRFN